MNKTEIINMALQRCGAAGINIAYEDTQEAAIADAAYERCRKLVLAQHPWKFAKKYATLAKNVDAPVVGYKYSFSLPADCISVVSVHPYAVEEDGTLIPGDMFRQHQALWEIVGQDVYSNFPLLAVRYVSNVVTDMPEEFANALGWRLAFEFAPYLQQGTNAAQQYYQLYVQALDEAKVLNDVQQRPDDVPDWRASKQVRAQFRDVYERW